MRELKNNLSRYLERVGDGDEVIVTDRGRPVARLNSIDDATDKLAALVAAGTAHTPTTTTITGSPAPPSSTRTFRGSYRPCLTYQASLPRAVDLDA